MNVAEGTLTSKSKEREIYIYMRKESVTLQKGHLFGTHAKRSRFFQPVSRPLPCVHIPGPCSSRFSTDIYSTQAPATAQQTLGAMCLPCNSSTLKRYRSVTW